MKKVFPLYIVFAIFAFFDLSCTDDYPVSPGGGDPDRLYPTTLHKLTGAEYDSLARRLNERLGSGFLAELDEYGLISYGSLFNWGSSSLNDTGSAVSLAKEAVLWLGEFTNVSDTAELVVREVNHCDDCTLTHWVVTFENQIYHGREVRKTQIVVVVTDERISVMGHHYREIFIPPMKIFTPDQIDQAVTGRVISYWCWVPGEFTITPESIDLSGMAGAVYPLEDGDSLQLRVTWKIPLSQPRGAPPTWLVYLDIFTGEIVAIEQLFIC